MTNLAGGLIRGVEEAQRVMDDAGATVLLLSDGHANVGVTDHDQLGTYTRGARGDGITVGAIGIGLGYDEELLSTLVAGGAGNVRFAEDHDAIGGALAEEVDGLLQQVAQGATLTVLPSDDVASVSLFNDLPVSPVERGFVCELGDFTSGETRKLLLQAKVPGKADLGVAQVCTLRLRWTNLAEMKTATHEIPVHVNVVPGDEAAGRIAKPEVRTELAFQEAQRSRIEAAEALRRGDRDAASAALNDAGDGIRQLIDLGVIPAAAAAPLQEEAANLAADARDALELDAIANAKRQLANFHLNQRKRGRRSRSNGSHRRIEEAAGRRDADADDASGGAATDERNGNAAR